MIEGVRVGACVAVGGMVGETVGIGTDVSERGRVSVMDSPGRGAFTLSARSSGVGGAVLQETRSMDNIIKALIGFNIELWMAERILWMTSELILSIWNYKATPSIRARKCYL